MSVESRSVDCGQLDSYATIYDTENEQTEEGVACVFDIDISTRQSVMFIQRRSHTLRNFLMERENESPGEVLGRGALKNENARNGKCNEIRLLLLPRNAK